MLLWVPASRRGSAGFHISSCRLEQHSSCLGYSLPASLMETRGVSSITWQYVHRHMCFMFFTVRNFPVTFRGRDVMFFKPKALEGWYVCIYGMYRHRAESKQTNYSQNTEVSWLCESQRKHRLTFDFPRNRFRPLALTVPCQTVVIMEQNFKMWLASSHWVSESEVQQTTSNTHGISWHLILELPNAIYSL